MPCCHADFAAVEGSDRGFTVGIPTFTFGPGDAFATGAEPQYRVIRIAPKGVGRDDLNALFRAALSYW
jgi:hypothetical protein